MRDRNFLLPVAAFGLLVPNGLFVYSTFFDSAGLATLSHNKLALAYMIDCFLALLLLARRFAREPIGRVKWHWFVILSLLGGLGFGLPMYWWLNRNAR